MARSDATSGIVQIYFQTINNGGCIALYDTLDLVIVPSPTPGFTFVENCFNIATPFTNTSTSVDPITGYDWTFEPGATSTQTDPSYVFLTEGSHNVQLIVTSPMVVRTHLYRLLMPILFLFASSIYRLHVYREGLISLIHRPFLILQLQHGAGILVMDQLSTQQDPIHNIQVQLLI